MASSPGISSSAIDAGRPERSFSMSPLRRRKMFPSPRPASLCCPFQAARQGPRPLTPETDLCGQPQDHTGPREDLSLRPFTCCLSSIRDPVLLPRERPFLGLEGSNPGYTQTPPRCPLQGLPSQPPAPRPPTAGVWRSPSEGGTAALSSFPCFLPLLVLRLSEGIRGTGPEA